MSAFFSPKDASSKTDKAKKLPTADAAGGAADGGPEEAAVLPGGRSGLAVLAVRFGIGSSKHDGEGRSITVEYDKARCADKPCACARAVLLDFEVLRCTSCFVSLRPCGSYKCLFSTRAFFFFLAARLNLLPCL